MAALVGAGRADTFDAAVTDFIRSMEREPLSGLLYGFTWLGNWLPAGIITIAVSVVLYAVLGHRRELVLLFAAVVGSAILNTLLKLAFQRARPDLYRMIEAHGFSFPSGHSMVAFGLYATLVYLLWRHMPGALSRSVLVVCGSVFIALIGISRIYFGVHYPSDVAAGYLASGCWLSLLISLYGSSLRKSVVTRPSGA